MREPACALEPNPAPWHTRIAVSVCHGDASAVSLIGSSWDSHDCLTQA